MNSIRWILALPVGLLVLAGCSSKGIISGRVLVPPSIGAATGDSSIVNTVIFVTGDRAVESPAQDTHPVIIQTDEGFHPHVLPVVEGDEVRFHNSGEVYHNAFSLSPAKRFDIGRYAPGQTRSVVLDQAGIVNVFCELHPASAGFIVVVPDPCFAQPDATGAFSLPKLRKGRYTVKAWHPVFGEVRREVDLPEKQDLNLELKF